MSEFWFDGTKAEMVAEWSRENGYLLVSQEQVEVGRRLATGLLNVEHEGLPAGTVVAFEVAKVRWEARAFLNRFTEPAFCRTPLHKSAVALARSILHLLGGEQ